MADESQFVPITIVEIITKDIGVPRNDGTPGSSLYSVPLRLSSTPPRVWAEHFVAAWDSPSEYTSMHRPGIARISGDRIILDGTTVEEIGKTHQKTLQLAVDVANKEYPAFEAKRRAAREAEQKRVADHKAQVSEAAKSVKFPR